MDHTKHLRFQLPVVIVGIQLLIVSFLWEETSHGTGLRSIGLWFIALFTLAGLMANWLVQKRYDRMAHSLLYLRKQLDMTGSAFYDTRNDRGPELDPKENMPGIFIINYVVIFAIGCTVIVASFRGVF